MSLTRGQNQTTVNLPRIYPTRLMWDVQGKSGDNSRTIILLSQQKKKKHFEKSQEKYAVSAENVYCISKIEHVDTLAS